VNDHILVLESGVAYALNGAIVAAMATQSTAFFIFIYLLCLLGEMFLVIAGEELLSGDATDAI
jgi:hypothetical protein